MTNSCFVDVVLVVFHIFLWSRISHVVVFGFWLVFGLFITLHHIYENDGCLSPSL